MITFMVTGTFLTLRISSYFLILFHCVISVKFISLFLVINLKVSLNGTGQTWLIQAWLF